MKQKLLKLAAKKEWDYYDLVEWLEIKIYLQKQGLLNEKT